MELGLLYHHHHRHHRHHNHDLHRHDDYHCHHHHLSCNLVSFVITIFIIIIFIVIIIVVVKVLPNLTIITSIAWYSKMLYKKQDISYISFMNQSENNFPELFITYIHFQIFFWWSCYVFHQLHYITFLLSYCHASLAVRFLGDERDLVIYHDDSIIINLLP